MKSKVISIDSTRPERWHISTGKPSGGRICCGYSSNRQHWFGLVEVDSIDRLSEVLDKAKSVMRTARAQNRQIEVAV